MAKLLPIPVGPKVGQRSVKPSPLAWQVRFLHRERKTIIKLGARNE